MVKSSDVKQFYEKYMDNIERENKIQADMRDFSIPEEEWKIRLRENSIERRKIYLENENLIYSIMKPFIDGEEEFTDELGDAILKYMDLLSRADVQNINITIGILDKIIDYYKKRDNLHSYMKACYYKAFFEQKCGDISNYYTAYEYFTKVTTHQDEFEKSDYDIKEIIVYSFVNRVYCSALSIRKGDDNKEALLALDEAEEFFSKKEVIECGEEFDFDRMLIRAKRVFVSVANDLFFDNEDDIDKNRQYINRAFEKATELFDYETEVNPDNISIKLVADYTYLKYLIGLYGKHEFFNEIYTFYIKKRKKALSEPGMVKSLVINVAPLVVRFCDCSDMTWQGRQEVKFDILNDLCDVYANHEIKTQNYYVNQKVWKVLDSILRTTSENDFAKHCIIDIAVMSDAESAIHAVMVRKIAMALAEKIFELRPEILVDNNYTTVESVLKEHKNIMNYINDAAVLHDIGKSLCFEKVNNYFRKITEAEFEIIKRHPVDGAMLLDKVPLMSKYRDICYYHHKYYNGKGGYPKDADNTRSDKKIYVDLITIADTIDSATDSIGRSYNASKSLKVVLCELKDGKGTRYNPDIVELIEENRELFEELKRITLREREDIYYQIYKRFS